MRVKRIDFQKVATINRRTLFLLIPVIILILQSFWLLPALNTRADLLIQGQAIASSEIHFVYVGVEVVKIVLLFVFGISLLNNHLLGRWLFNVTKATISDMVKTPEQKNLRVKEHEILDSRSYIINLTRKGIEIAEQT